MTSTNTDASLAPYMAYAIIRDGLVAEDFMLDETVAPYPIDTETDKGDLCEGILLPHDRCQKALDVNRA